MVGHCDGPFRDGFPSVELVVVRVMVVRRASACHCVWGRRACPWPPAERSVVVTVGVLCFCSCARGVVRVFFVSVSRVHCLWLCVTFHECVWLCARVIVRGLSQVSVGLARDVVVRRASACHSMAWLVQLVCCPCVCARVGWSQ